MTSKVFAQNSDGSGGCPHAVLRYIVDCGYHTIDCERCHKRWTLMQHGTKPRYSEDGLLNHADADASYPADQCVDPRDANR